MEMTIDALAREIGMEAHEIRMKNMVPESAMPFMSIAKKHFDSGNYAKSVEMAVDMIGLEKVRANQGAPTDDGRIIGVGMGSYVEQTAHWHLCFFELGRCNGAWLRTGDGQAHARRRIGTSHRCSKSRTRHGNLDGADGL